MIKDFEKGLREVGVPPSQAGAFLTGFWNGWYNGGAETISTINKALNEGKSPEEALIIANQALNDGLAESGHTFVPDKGVVH